MLIIVWKIIFVCCVIQLIILNFTLLNLAIIGIAGWCLVAIQVNGKPDEPVQITGDRSVELYYSQDSDRSYGNRS